MAHHHMRGRAPAGLILEIDIGERVAVAVADDETLLTQLKSESTYGPGRREAAGLRHPARLRDRNAMYNIADKMIVKEPVITTVRLRSIDWVIGVPPGCF